MHRIQMEFVYQAGGMLRVRANSLEWGLDWLVAVSLDPCDPSTAMLDFRSDERCDTMGLSTNTPEFKVVETYAQAKGIPCPPYVVPPVREPTKFVPWNPEPCQTDALTEFLNGRRNLKPEEPSSPS